MLVLYVATAGIVSPRVPNGDLPLGAGVALPLTGSPLFNALGLAVGLGVGLGAWLNSQYLASIIFAIGIGSAALGAYLVASRLRQVLTRQSRVLSAVSVICTIFGFALLAIIAGVHPVKDLSLHKVGARLYEVGGVGLGLGLLGLWRPHGERSVGENGVDPPLKGVRLGLRSLLIKALPVSSAYVLIPLVAMEGARAVRLLFGAAIVVLLGAFGIVSGAVVVFLLLVVLAWGLGSEVCSLSYSDFGEHSLFSTLPLDGGKQQRREVRVSALFAIVVLLGASALDFLLLGEPHLVTLSVAPIVGGTASVVAGAYVAFTLISQEDTASPTGWKRRLTLPLMMALYAVIPLLSLIQMHDAYLSGGDLFVPAISASTFSLVFPLAATSWLARKASYGMNE